VDIKWYGHGCFRLKERSAVAFTDPYPLTIPNATRPRAKADIVTADLGAGLKNPLDGFTNTPYLVQRPGEYEVSGIFVTGLPTAPDTKKNNDSTTHHTMMIFQFEDVSVCHLGRLGHVLGQEEVDKLSEVDILLVPVGGHGVLNASQAAEVISLIEPLIVIPMYFDVDGAAPSFDSAEKFLKEMGATAVTPIDELKITKSGLPEETQIVILRPG
jgi:L-ascorbate metabolism protein UlaG (beta-lactamase superfamily)